VRFYVFLTAICLHVSCSHEAPTAVAKKPVLSKPEYSTASIAPSGESKPAPLAPGRMATVYGANLGPAQACWGTADPSRRETPNPQRPNQTDVETKVFPAKLCDAEVRVGGIAAGLVYVSAGQINFKVPQNVLTKGDTTVLVTYKDQAGPAVSIPLTTDAPPVPAEQIAAAMWSDLQRVKWEQRYERGCTAVPAQQGLRGGLYGHAYYCKQSSGPAIAESFYYPVDPANPKILLLRADIRPAFTYSELSAEVEQFLIRRLTKAYGAPVAPDSVTEIGAYRPDPGLSWHTGKLTIFVHRNRNAVAPAGVRLGVILIAVRDELLEQRRVAQSLLVTGARESQAPKSEADRVKAAEQTLADLLRLLRQSTGEPAQRAEALVAADRLAVRLGALLVVRETVVEGAAKVRAELAPLGIQYGGVGHDSGALDYDHSLLARAWKEYPATPAGQRAFLMLQRLGCEVKSVGCDGPNCFLAVIQQGASFLERYPDTSIRKEQTYHLALAHETWWSLSLAEPGDTTAAGAKVTREAGERARQRAIEFYEQLIRVAPGTPEAKAAEIALPRLKLKFDSRERTFFCFSC
jgi:uncharacterized protein (TIGR03437 family)